MNVFKNRVGLNLSLRADESCVMGQQLASYSYEYAHMPKNLSVLLPSLLPSQTYPLSLVDLPRLSQTSIIYTCLGFKWEQLWAGERAMPWGFLTLICFSAQADAILHSLSQVLFPG